MKEKTQEKRLFTFRVKYNYGSYHSAEDSYHYYPAYSAEEALNNHCFMMERKRLDCQIKSVERLCPWTEQWEDMSEVIHSEH